MTNRIQPPTVSTRVKYVYFDDPNEIVERLELLIGEREAGHTGVDNEIFAILKELQERFDYEYGKIKMVPSILRWTSDQNVSLNKAFSLKLSKTQMNRTV